MKYDCDKFLTELNKLFERNEEKGSVFITMKRSEFLFWQFRGLPPLPHLRYLTANLIPYLPLCLTSATS